MKSTPLTDKGRFRVIRHEGSITFYEIQDFLNEEFKSPKRAVAINFKELIDAQEVCRIINKEWAEFQRNPQ